MGCFFSCIPATVTLSAIERGLQSFLTVSSTSNVYSMLPVFVQGCSMAAWFHGFHMPCLRVMSTAEFQGSLLNFGSIQLGSVMTSLCISAISLAVQSLV